MKGCNANCRQGGLMNKSNCYESRGFSNSFLPGPAWKKQALNFIDVWDTRCMRQLHAGSPNCSDFEFEKQRLAVNFKD